MLDALARADQTPGEDHRSPGGRRPLLWAEVCGRSVLNHDDVFGRDIVYLEQSIASDRRLGDKERGLPRELFKNPTLVRRRVREHGVQNENERHGQPVDEREHILAVGTAEDAKFVLDNGDVIGVQDVRCLFKRCWVVANPFGDHLVGVVQDIGLLNTADDPDLAVACHRSRERGSERGDAALRWRERANETKPQVAARHGCGGIGCGCQFRQKDRLGLGAEVVG